MGSRQNLNNFAEMPSTPVAFLVSNLDTIFRTSSSDTLLKEKIGVSSGIFSTIFMTLGCVEGSFGVSPELPMSVATFTKKSLKTLHTCSWSEIIFSSSARRISEPPLVPF